MEKSVNWTDKVKCLDETIRKEIGIQKLTFFKFVI